MKPLTVVFLLLLLTLTGASAADQKSGKIDRFEKELQDSTGKAPRPKENFHAADGATNNENSK